MNSPTTAAAWARAEPRNCSSNESLAAEGKIPATVPLGFSADETLDVGEDTGTPSADYDCPFRFTGKIDKVTVELK